MITATEHPISKVLGDDYVHEIPPYQRPYSWTETEAVQLLEDLMEAQSDSKDEQYFLGSIVIIQAKGQKTSFVVDGQQRLTTLTILAAALRDSSDNEKEKVALGQAVYIEPNPFMEQTEAVRLNAHAEDRVFFRNAIQVPKSDGTLALTPPVPQTEAQSLMWTNYQALKKKVADLSPIDRQQLVVFLLNKCVLVVVSTESRGAALRIFTVLNARGMPLSNADIIKADLLSKFRDTNELASEAAHWRQFENDLGRDDFADLLEHLRFIRERTKNRRNLSDAYSEYFGKQDVHQVKSFLHHEMSDAKTWFTRITDSDVAIFTPELQSAAKDALAGLSLLPNKDWVAPAMGAALKLGATEELAKVWQAMEGTAWIMQLCRKYDTERIGKYADFLKSLDQSYAHSIASLKPSKSEAADAKAVLEGDLYGRFPTRVVRALLERLDLLIADQPVSWAGIKTVEHILPQNPSMEEWGNFTTKDRNNTLHRLGNLVLLTSRKNSSASNSSFAEKKEVYFGLSNKAASKKRATYASVQELATIKDWTYHEFSARHARHLKLLCERWSLN
jgi:hypothetical protein